MAVAAPPSAAVTAAPSMMTGAPPMMARAPSPPAVAVGAPPPPLATGALLSVGAVPRLIPAVPAPHNLFPPSLPFLLPVLPSPPLLHTGFGHLLLFALHCLHSVRPAQDPQRHIVTRI